MDRKALVEKFGLTATSEVMSPVIDKIVQVAPTNITVLLQGESGVGKDVVARTLHGLSKRKDENLVIVNCGAIPEGIIESELFGHEKGSFTGAHEAREGYFEKANNGTIFLDEIGDTPKNVQVKLLRILENGEFFRVGSSKSRKTDTRIIAATNRDLWQDVQNGSFREDLYYRLNTVTIRIPALRERTDDIIPIFRRFVLEFSRQYDSIFQGFDDDAQALLKSYRWPGNIRELRNVAEQLVVLEKSQFITPAILAKYLKGRQSHGSADNLPMLYNRSDFNGNSFGNKDTSGENELLFRTLVEMRNELSDLKKMVGTLLYSQFRPGSMDKNLLGSGESASIPPPFTNYPMAGAYDPSHVFQQAEETIPHHEEENNDDLLFDRDEIPSLEQAEKYLIEKALRHFEGNRRKASEALGVSERTLYRKLDQYNLT